MKSSSKEIFRFVITGGVCFLIELISLIFFRDAVGLPTLAATPIAFLISVIFNYILCVRWVFSGADGQRASAKAGFLITSVMGLLLNELLMWLFGVHVSGAGEGRNLHHKKRHGNIRDAG